MKDRRVQGRLYGFRTTCNCGHHAFIHGTGLQLCEQCFACGLDIQSDLQVMQVKNFGRRGRTKHTHLVDVDTTNREDAYPIPEARALRENMEKKMAGSEQKFDKPRRLKT